MRPYVVGKNKSFCGREFELAKLHKIGEAGGSGIIVLYGRRRVGKIELLVAKLFVAEMS